jgi:hypothetical protein
MLYKKKYRNFKGKKKKLKIKNRKIIKKLKQKTTLYFI